MPEKENLRLTPHDLVENAGHDEGERKPQHRGRRRPGPARRRGGEPGGPRREHERDAEIGRRRRREHPDDAVAGAKHDDEERDVERVAAGDAGGDPPRLVEGLERVREELEKDLEDREREGYLEIQAEPRRTVPEETGRRAASEMRGGDEDDPHGELQDDEPPERLEESLETAAHPQQRYELHERGVETEHDEHDREAEYRSQHAQRAPADGAERPDDDDVARESRGEREHAGAEAPRHRAGDLLDRHGAPSTPGTNPG